MAQNFISKPPTKSPVDIDGSVTTAWSAWFESAFQILFAQAQSGTTAQRPTVGLFIGRPYFDETLGHVIHWQGTKWVKPTGLDA